MLKDIGKRMIIRLDKSFKNSNEFGKIISDNIRVSFYGTIIV